MSCTPAALLLVVRPQQALYQRRNTLSSMDLCIHCRVSEITASTSESRCVAPCLSSLSSESLVYEDAGFANFTITREGGSSGIVTVVFETTPDAAVDGVDYQGQSLIVSFADGETRER